MNVIFLGPPGVGKGTQSVRASNAFQMCHISTGDMMRRAIANDTELGAQVKSYLDAGQLVPDDMVIALVADRLGHVDCAGGCILDGFPRTEAQAESLDAFFESTGSKIDAVIQLTASPEVLQKRMLDRANKQGRSDDTPETILKRLEVYERQTAPLVAYYQRADLLFPVDGIGTPDEVSARIAAVLESRR